MQEAQGLNEHGITPKLKINTHPQQIYDRQILSVLSELNTSKKETMSKYFLNIFLRADSTLRTHWGRKKNKIKRRTKVENKNILGRIHL